MKMRAIFLLTLFSAASMPLTLVAQTVAADAETKLDEVRVSGEAAEDGVAGGAPVAVVSGETMARKQSASIAAALRDEPGIAMERADNPLTAAIMVRGFGGNSVMPGDPNVTITVDGGSVNSGQNYRNSGMGVVDPALLKSLRVYKGQLNALEFGSGLAGGSVVAETIDGADLTGDEVGFKFRQLLGAHSNGGGWVTSSTLAWQPSANVDTLFNYTRRASGQQKAGAGATVPLEPASGFNLPTYLFKTRVRFGDGHALSFSVNRFSDMEANASFGATLYSAGFARGTRWRNGTVGALAYTWDPAGNDLVDLELKFTNSKQQMRFQGYAPGSFDGDYNYETRTATLKNTARFTTGAINHTLRAGLTWQREERDTPLVRLASAGIDTRTGIYVLDEMDFGNDLLVTAGARIERQQFSNLRRWAMVTPPPPAPQVPVLTLVNLADYTHTAKTLGLGFEKGFGNGLTAFGSYSIGDGLPTIDSGFYNWADTALPIPSETRKVRTIEAGLKYRGNDVFFSGDSLRASISVYKTTTRRPHQAFPSGANNGLDFRGIELQASYQEARGFYGRIAATLVDNREQPIATGVWRDYTYSPPSTLALTLGKTWDNGVDLSWTLNAAQGQTLNGTRYAGFGVHNVALNYTPQGGVLAGATVSLGVDNLFDRNYGVTRGGNIPELGRNVKLTLSKTF